MAAAMAQGPGCLEKFIFPVLAPQTSPSRAQLGLLWWKCEGSLLSVTLAVTQEPPGCSCRAHRSLLSPQGCLLQCWLRAQPGALREHQVLAEFLHGLDIPGECQRGWEHSSTIRGQPQHPEPEVRHPQPILGALGAAEMWGLPLGPLGMCRAELSGACGV